MAMLASCVTARAADNKENRDKLFSDPYIRKNVLEGAADSGVMVEHPCPTMNYVARPAVTILEPLDFDADGFAIKGAWREVVDAKGCGASRTLNVAVTVEGPRKLHFTTIFPGDTHASMKLQDDSLDYALDQAVKAGGNRESNCKVHYIRDTQFVADDGPAAANTEQAPWHELWSIETCKQLYVVPMKFKPTPKGIDFTADRAAIKILPRPN